MQAAFFGDVHGRLDLLTKLLEILEKDYPAAKIYSTGDLVDRGPNSKGVLDLIIEKGIKPVRGNHDDMFVKFLNGDRYALQGHLQDGMKGVSTAVSYGFRREFVGVHIADDYREAVPKSHKDFLNSLPLYRIIELENEVTGTISKYFLSHAGIGTWAWHLVTEAGENSTLELALDWIDENCGQEDMLWGHKDIGSLAKIPGYTQIIGHKPVEFPVIELDRGIMIDSGCGHYDRPLSAIILPTCQVVSVHPDGV